MYLAFCINHKFWTFLFCGLNALIWSAFTNGTCFYSSLIWLWLVSFKFIVVTSNFLFCMRFCFLSIFNIDKLQNFNDICFFVKRKKKWYTSLYNQQLKKNTYTAKPVVLEIPYRKFRPKKIFFSFCLLIIEIKKWIILCNFIYRFGNRQIFDSHLNYFDLKLKFNNWLYYFKLLIGKGKN